MTGCSSRSSSYRGIGCLAAVAPVTLLAGPGGRRPLRFCGAGPLVAAAVQSLAQGCLFVVVFRLADGIRDARPVPVLITPLALAAVTLSLTALALRSGEAR